MRRIALLTAVLGAVAWATVPAALASTSETLTSCGQVSNGSYRGWSISEHGLGCVEAKKMVLHALDHGPSFERVTCTYSPPAGLPRSYVCTGHDTRGRPVGLHFKISSERRRG